MISRKELEYMARALGLNSYQAEKDYLQHAFLSALYAVSAGEFIFKGGTALPEGVRAWQVFGRFGFYICRREERCGRAAPKGS